MIYEILHDYKVIKFIPIMLVCGAFVILICDVLKSSVNLSSTELLVIIGGFSLAITSYSLLAFSKKNKFEYKKYGDFIDSLSRSFGKSGDVSNADAARSGELDRLLQDARKKSEELDDVCEMLGIRASAISSRTLSDKYKWYSRSERALSIGYDIVAITLSVVGLYILVQALQSTGHDETSITIMKMAVTVGSFTISGFVFRRGTFHHREAKAAKRTELALSQYKPFIATLPQETQNEIIAEMARRVFINGDMDHSEERLADLVGRKGTDLPALVELLKLVNGKN